MKSSNLFSLFCIPLVFTIISCTPKVAEVVTETPEVPVTPAPIVKEDNNPCTTLNELSARKKDEAETAYVLYKDYLKQGNYNEAFSYWEKAYYMAPAANGKIKYQYEDGTKIYKHLYDNTDSPELKQTYVDSIMSIYDKRIECYGEAAYIAGRKAFDYYYYYPTQSNTDEVYDLFKQAIDSKKEKSDYFVINPFTKILSDKINDEEISLEEGRKYTTYIMDAIQYGSDSNKNKEAWDIINAYAPARLENLEGVKGLYDCSYYENKYLAIYKANPTDCETINTSYGRMLWGGCDKSSPAVAEVFKAKQTNCYTPPPPEGPLKKAYNAYSEGQYKEAVRLFDEFVNTTTDNAKKFKYNLLIAKIYYGDIKNFPTSRKYARLASSFKPSSGEPFLLIGKLYASSGPLCGPGRGWDSQIVTWPAIDMFEKAAKDPLVSDEAKKLIRTYKQYMPKKEDIFIRNIKAGSSITVPCWIREKTTVRTAD